MKGISYITDHQNKRKSVIIDLKTIEDHEEEIYDLIDTIIAESRKHDETFDWEEAKNLLLQKRNK